MKISGDKLELGAGSNPTPGYIHNDIRPLEHIEVVCDILEITNYVRPGWTKIKMAHCLEHFGKQDIKQILEDCYCLLQKNGEVIIDVPNLSWQTQAHYLREISDEEAVYFIFGEQDYAENTHKYGFTKRLLAEALTNARFNATVTDIGQVLIGVGVK